MSSRSARRLASFALLGAVVAAAQEDPRAALDAIAARAEREPDAALGALDALLGSQALDASVRRRAELARPGLLARVGRSDEARAGWEALLRRGEDVAAPLLSLVGATLTVEATASPGAPLALRLEGARTGPLAVRLYRVSGARLRAEVEADPGRGLTRHLRAPPAAALSRVAEWQAAEPAPDASVTTRSPGALAPGVYLATVTARGVTVPAPIVVAPALAVARRRAGPGLLWLVDRARGAPLGGLAVQALDAEGAPGALLGRTSDAGTLAWVDAPAAALVWLDAPDPLPLVISLPGPTAPPPTAPPALRLDLPVYRPGQALRARACGLPRDARVDAALIDPRGVPVHTARVVVDGAGVGEAALRVPVDAPPGEWEVAVGAARATARVLPAPVPGVEVTLVLPEAVVTGPRARLEGRVEGRLVTGAPLEGRTVRWRVRAQAASPPFEPEPGPTPPFALGAEPVAGGDLVASGEAALDARGEAPVDVALPAFERPTLLRVEAEVLLGPGPPGAAPAAVAFVAAAPRDLLVALRPARHVVAPTEDVVVDARGAWLDGRPAARADLELTASLRPVDGGPPRVERRAVRIDEAGRARASFLFDAPGEVALQLTGRDAGGRDVAAVSSLRVVAPGGAAVERARASLQLEAPPGPEAPEARLLIELPFERGWALVTCEDAAGASAPGAQVVEVAGGRARAVVPTGEHDVVLTAAHAGVVHEARARVVAPVAPLRLEVRPEAPGLRVHVTDLDGRGRLAGARAWVYPDATAAVLARTSGAPSSSPLAPGPEGTRARAPETSTPLAWPALEGAGGQAAWTNGLGIGGLRLGAQAAPSWARVEVADRRGQTGAAWCRLDPPAGPLDVRLVGPAHAVDGDRTELAALVTVRDLGALPEAAVLRVTWSAEGAELRAPRVEGTRPVLLGDAGPGALRLEPARAFRVVLPVTPAWAGPGRGPGPSAARASVRVEVEGAPATAATAAWTCSVRPRGLVEVVSFAAEVAPDGAMQRSLEVPPQAIAGSARLELALDPEPATAVLAAAGALQGSDDPLRGPLHALLARRRVDALLAARRLRPPAAAWPPASVEEDVRRVLGALAAARDERGAWSERTAELCLVLVDLRAEGVDVPAALLEPALAALAARADVARDGRAVLALARAGRLPARIAHAIDAPAASSDERPALAQALLVAGEARRGEEALAAAVVGARTMSGVQGRADLLALLLERGEAPALQAELTAALLAS